jgi:hypothetical protein
MPSVLGIRALVGIVTLTSACSSRSAAPQVAACDSCSAGLACTTASSRAVCEAADAASSPVSVPEVDGSACRYDPSSPLASDALIAGFQVAEFDATYSAAQPEELQFVPPDGARLVVCALFACTPVIQSDAETSASGGKGSIMNFDACVLSSEEIPSTRRTFDIDDASLAAPCKNGAGAACASTFDLLQAGCWAYDASHIVGATRLFPVDPRSSFLWNDQIANCFASSDQGSACAPLKQTLRVGTCDRGACMPHCQTAQDCEIELVGRTTAAQVADGGAEGGPDASAATTCSYSCEAIPGREDLGVCRKSIP